jgi:hypothetical protein
MVPRKQPPPDDTAEATSKVDPKQRRRVQRAFKEFSAQHGQNLLSAAPELVGKQLVVQVALLKGAHFPRLALYRYDPVTGKLSSDFVPVTLVEGEKVYAGSVGAKSGVVYALFCDYEGPAKSGLDVNVFYAPDPPKAWPPDLGTKAAGRKFEASGKPVAFFVRVPTEGAIP